MPKLIGSAPTLDALLNLIKQRYGWNITHVDVQGAVYNSNGVIDGVRVIERKGRYRFEMEH
jgi:hypothetical protein